MTTVHTGQRGRPAVHIDPDVLREAMSTGRKITISALARTLGVHRHTIRKQLIAHHIPRPAYSDIPDEDLDELIQAYKEYKPNSGYRYVMGFLSNAGLRVQQERVKASLRRVDGLRHVLRNHAAIDRQVYVVPYPNYLWHIDGHHKLIRWGIVIHGGADGYDRMVCRHHDMNVASCLFIITTVDHAARKLQQPSFNGAGVISRGCSEVRNSVTRPR